jgi:hypothetical protein
MCKNEGDKVQNFNQKVITGRIGEAAEITDKGATFSITYKQFDKVIKIPCCIMKDRTELLRSVADKYLHKGNIGKAITVAGSDFYYEDKIILMAERIELADDVLAKNE